MKVERFLSLLGAEFYTGVPDSLLKALCDYLCATYGDDAAHHIIAANEGNCAALAAGYHLATGKTPVVYMQNSGEGNTINPLASLLNPEVYGIPVLFIIGWRGEPGVHDEPQHVFQGQVTVKLMEDMGVATFVVSAETTEAEVARAMDAFRPLLASGRQAAFIIRKGALKWDGQVTYQNDCAMRREEIIGHVLRFSGDDPVVSTTGKASRELFELRERQGQGHERDFLTVGCMGHASSIAMGIALQKPDTRVWCVDGDGAALMHMGAMAVIGAHHPRNLVHIIINNGAHETVGGMPTAASRINITGVARACGYATAVRVDTAEALDEALSAARQGGELALIEVACAIGARSDLGRPTTSPMENKRQFMTHLQQSHN